MLVRRIAGLAALAAGVCWTVKAAAVLAGAGRPDYVAEFTPAAQGLAVAALSWAFACGPVARLVALGALGAGVAAAMAYVSAPEDFVYNVAMFLATMLVVAGLLLVGRALRKRESLGRRSRLPIRLGLWTVPLILTGGLLSSVNERLLELPVLLLGLAWTWLAAVLLIDRLTTPKQPRPGKATKAPAPRQRAATAPRR